MRLVIDTNIIISSLISNSVRRSILLNSGYEFRSPEYTYKEIINQISYARFKIKLKYLKKIKHPSIPQDAGLFL